MRVVLLKNVPKLGRAGEVKEVSMGYARNFLLAKNLATPATADILARLEKQGKTKAKAAEKDLKNVQGQASGLDGQEIELKEKASEQGKLYAGVTAAKIVKALGTQGFKIDKKWVALKEPIKEVGEHEVVLKMEHGLEVKIKVNIISG